MYRNTFMTCSCVNSSWNGQILAVDWGQCILPYSFEQELFRFLTRFLERQKDPILFCQKGGANSMKFKTMKFKTMKSWKIFNFIVMFSKHDWNVTVQWIGDLQTFNMQYLERNNVCLVDGIVKICYIVTATWFLF